MELVAVNYVAVLVAAVVSFIIGWAWYSPLLFMKQWMHWSGMTQEKMQSMPKGKMGQSMGLGFVAVLVSVYVLAQLVALAQVSSISGALQLGFLVWLGFYATIQLGGFLWEGRPFKLYVLQVGQTLACTLVVAVVLALWR